MEISVVDLENSCRACFISDLSLESMFECTLDELSFYQIFKMMLAPFSDLNPDGSKLMCNECKNKLMKFYNFRKTLVENELYSKTWTKPMIDTAIIYTSDDSQTEICTDKPSNVDRVHNKAVVERKSSRKSTIDSKSNIVSLENLNCNFCNRSFKQSCALKKHLLLHNPERGEYQCETCLKRFSTSALLIRHKVIHSTLFKKSKIKEKNGKLLECQCLICKSFMNGKDALSSHYRVHKNESMSCGICSESFNSVGEFIKHSKIHEQNSIYQCFECKVQFTVQEKLIDHLLIHQKNRPFECQICNKSFVKKKKMEIHMASHQNVKDVLCPICGQLFKTKDILSRHLTRHKGEKLISCKKCPRKFFFKYELVSHMLSHNGQKTHICEVCGSAFSTNSSMKKHSKIHFKSEPTFECTYCSKRFSTNGILKKHVRIHTGEKPFKCNQCSKSFIQSGDMFKHIKTHIGKNVYKCELENCDQAFEKHGQLKIHWTKDHFEKAENQEKLG